MCSVVVSWCPLSYPAVDPNVPKGVGGPREDPLPPFVPPLRGRLAVVLCGIGQPPFTRRRVNTHTHTYIHIKHYISNTKMQYYNPTPRTCPARRPSPGRCSRGASSRNTPPLPKKKCARNDNGMFKGYMIISPMSGVGVRSVGVCDVGQKRA